MSVECLKHGEKCLRCGVEVEDQLARQTAESGILADKVAHYLGLANSWHERAEKAEAELAIMTDERNEWEKRANEYSAELVALKATPEAAPRPPHPASHCDVCAEYPDPKDHLRPCGNCGDEGHALWECVLPERAPQSVAAPCVWCDGNKGEWMDRSQHVGDDSVWVPCPKCAPQAVAEPKSEICDGIGCRRDCCAPSVGEKP